MRSIVNVSVEDRATDTGNMHKNLVKIARVVPEISSRTDRQIHRHILITIHRNRSRGQNNYANGTTIGYHLTLWKFLRNRSRNTRNGVRLFSKFVKFTVSGSPHRWTHQGEIWRGTADLSLLRQMFTLIAASCHPFRVVSRKSDWILKFMGSYTHIPSVQYNNTMLEGVLLHRYTLNRSTEHCSHVIQTLHVL